MERIEVIDEKVNKIIKFGEKISPYVEGIFDKKINIEKNDNNCCVM